MIMLFLSPSFRPLYVERTKNMMKTSDTFLPAEELLELYQIILPCTFITFYCISKSFALCSGM